MDSTNHTRRIEWMDTAKGICITLVVFNHILIYHGFHDYRPDFFMFFNDFMSSFRMPLYFFLSGVFFKSYGGGFFFVKKKVNKILIPFAFWYIVSILLTPVTDDIGEWRYCDFCTNKYVVLNFYFSDCQGVNGPLWFLLCLFEVNVIFCLLQMSIKKRSMLYLASFMTGVLGLLLSYFSINLHASLDTALTCLPFFVFGYMVKNDTNILISSTHDRQLLLLSLLFGIICFLLSDYAAFYSNSFSQQSYFTIYPCGFLGTLMILFIAKNVGIARLITYFGRYSIIILCTHFLILKIINCFLLGQIHGVLLKILASFIVVMTIEYAIIPILKKYMPYVTAQKDLFV